nr:hypothetical protein [Tanacetum cinerariifolium]
MRNQRKFAAQIPGGTLFICDVVATCVRSTRGATQGKNTFLCCVEMIRSHFTQENVNRPALMLYTYAMLWKQENG